MPIIKSAIKKLRVDKKRTSRNARFEAAFKKAIKDFKSKIAAHKKVDLSAIAKTVDRAVTKKIIHKNKAAHLKSAFAKLLKKKTVKK